MNHFESLESRMLLSAPVFVEAHAGPIHASIPGLLAARIVIPKVRGTWSGYFANSLGEQGVIYMRITKQTGSKFWGTLTDNDNFKYSLKGTIGVNRTMKGSLSGSGGTGTLTGKVSFNGKAWVGRYVGAGSQGAVIGSFRLDRIA